MQEFQERNVFFDSIPLPDADDFCRCRDWCVEDYDLAVWQPEEALSGEQATEINQVAQCGAIDVMETDLSLQTTETEITAEASATEELEQWPEPMPTIAPVPKPAPIPVRKPCKSCGNAAVNGMFVTSYDNLVPAPAPTPMPVPVVSDTVTNDAQAELEAKLQDDIAQLTPADNAYNDWLWPDGAPETAVEDVDNASGYEQELLHF